MGGGVSRFSSKLFCLTVLKNSVGEPFSVSLASGIENVRDKRGVRVSRFSVEIFLSHSAEKFRRGTLPGSRKILVSKLLMHMGGGAYHDFPS